MVRVGERVRVRQNVEWLVGTVIERRDVAGRGFVLVCWDATDKGVPLDMSYAPLGASWLPEVGVKRL